MPKKHKLQRGHRDIATSVVNKGKTNYVKVSRFTTSKESWKMLQIQQFK
jgi:hypothetical protein